ncbi:MAG: SDR family NAD(P)-dependent oxidoreductase [Chitinophagia bacterium]|jgi:NAD(P)-dependent dehydrogenase (short-subunit alcohol dehydrogenase family)
MSKTILITGTSQGIGHALTKLLLINGYSVIGTSTTGIDNINDNYYKSCSLDLSNLDSIAAFENIFQNEIVKVDILINNAGIGPDLDFELPEEISFKKTFDVNVTGTTFFTEQMLKHLTIGGKIINISSKMGSIDFCEKNDSVAYRMSKAALNMYTKILSNRLQGKQLVASVHPGWVRTNISKSNINGRLSPEESAQKIFEFITSDFKSGIFWNVETETECPW